MYCTVYEEAAGVPTRQESGIAGNKSVFSLLRNITLEMFNHIIKVKEKQKHLIQFEYNTEHRGFIFIFYKHVT